MGRAVRRRPVRRAGRAEQVHPLRLGAGALRRHRVAGAHHGAVPGRAAHRGAARRAAGRAGQPRRGRRRRQLRAAGHRRGRARRAGARADRPGRRRIWAAGCGPGGRATTRWPPCSGCGCATRCDGSPPACSTWSARWPPRPPRTRRRSCRARPICSPPSRSCWRTICSRTPIRCCATWTGSSTSTSARRCRRTAPGRWPARRWGWIPDAIAADLGFAAAADNSDRRHRRPGFRRRGGVRVRHDRRRPVPAGRGHHHLELDGIRLRHAARLLVHRQLDHAAEEEPGHRRAGPRQVRPADRKPDRACWPR